MKELIIIISILCNILLFNSISESKNLPANSSVPVYYPEGTIGSISPYFIWYDKYNERDDSSIKYRLTLKPEKGPGINPVLIKPTIYNKYYYFFKFTSLLEPGKYGYNIERLEDNKPAGSKYFHDLKYPVNGEFVFDPDEKTQKEDLSPERLIEYLAKEKENRLTNGYNFLFFSAAGVSCFGIGLLFYKVLEFGIISRIIYYIAFTSSGIGIGASGYYGYKYITEKNQLQKIIDMERNVSINGSVSSETITVDFKYSF